VVDIGQDFAVAPGNDAYEHFTVPTNFQSGIWIRAAEIRPASPSSTTCTSTWCGEQQTGPTSIEGMRQLSDFRCATAS
jgi:hypothetical protein